jgi:hypothetical protein
MKKAIYILLVSFVASLSFVSCTEEEVQPKFETEGTVGGNASERPS